MTVELSDTDVIFIYGQFKKQLAKIEKEPVPADSSNKKTNENKRASYLSVIEKLSSQVPGLKRMDNYF